MLVAGPKTLGMIAELCQSKCCALGITDLQTGADQLTFQFGYDAHHLRLQKCGVLNPYFVSLRSVPAGTVVKSATLINDKELIQSRYYQEWLKPQGLLDTIRLVVLKTGQCTVGLTATRLESQGRYGVAEVRLLTLLAPHVQRSVAVADVFNLRTIKAELLEATLDALACAVYLTDHQGQVLYANRAAQRQLKTGDVLRVQGDRLTARDEAAQSSLTKAIAEGAAGAISVPLPGANSKGLVATILPLERAQGRKLPLPSEATVAIFAQDPMLERHVPGQAFAKLFGLTTSELRVLLAMSPAYFIKDTAERLGISEATAKTHLHHIYAKTGTSKQTELMSLLLGCALPVELDPKPLLANPEEPSTNRK